MTRKELVLASVNYKKGIGLEIGPLTSPILSREEARIFYADHRSQKGLRKKYKDAPLNIDDIAPVDYVVKNTLQQAVAGQKFDYVIACHVIEHIPDMVRWLRDIASILKPHGTLALAIPDKRFTFDLERNVSTPADVIGAYVDQYKKPSSAMMYDYASKSRNDIVSSDVWAYPYGDWSKKPHMFSAAESYGMCEENSRPGGYVDCHCYVFTPHSFFEILRTLMEHKLTDLEVADYEETNDLNIEFYVSLRKVTHSKTTLRRQLASLPKIRAEATPAALQSMNNKLREKVIALESEMHTLQTSKSWRLTQPLRAILKQVSSTRRV